MWPKVHADPVDFPEDMEAAKIKGMQFRSEYDKDVQFVLARTNHHVHLATKKGRVPLSACRAKRKNKTLECKQLFRKVEIRRATVVDWQTSCLCVGAEAA